MLRKHVSVCFAIVISSFVSCNVQNLMGHFSATCISTTSRTLPCVCRNVSTGMIGMAFELSPVGAPTSGGGVCASLSPRVVFSATVRVKVDDDNVDDCCLQTAPPSSSTVHHMVGGDIEIDDRAIGARQAPSIADPCAYANIQISSDVETRSLDISCKCCFVTIRSVFCLLL